MAATPAAVVFPYYNRNNRSLTNESGTPKLPRGTYCRRPDPGQFLSKAQSIIDTQYATPRINVCRLPVSARRSAHSLTQGDLKSWPLGSASSAVVAIRYFDRYAHSRPTNCFDNGSCVASGFASVSADAVAPNKARIAAIRRACMLVGILHGFRD
jgi:hypothetical protein